MVDVTMYYVLELCTIGSLTSVNTGTCWNLPSANTDAFSTFPTYIFRVEPTYVLSDTKIINFTCILQKVMMSWSREEIMMFFLLPQTHSGFCKNLPNPKVLVTNMDFEWYPWGPVLMIIPHWFIYSFSLI